jgi:tRNA U34 5-methylaminomethyl-2-thiouridine-forming methyltransferase MnmC
MAREIFITGDGSSSVHIPSLEATYHSRHGAITESLHVFIDAAFIPLHQQAPAELRCNIFEMGFGTGLNALLTLVEAEKLQRKVFYNTIEANPLENEIFSQLNYCHQLNRPDLLEVFNQLHLCPWEGEVTITPFFNFKKNKTTLDQFSTPQSFHIIYYDAFAPKAQPGLWTKEIFEKLFQMLSPGGLLTTYCSKSDVRRAMRTAGFKVEKLAGPKGKREMVLARRD